MLFALKLTLVPLFIAGVTLGSRRWGPRIGGWLNAVPMVAGPVLLFLAIEQGAAFASRAALNTLAGLIGVATFSLAYAWAALRRPWWIARATGAIAFLRSFLPAMWSFVLFCFVLTIALVPFGWLLGFAAALAVQGCAQALVLL